MTTYHYFNEQGQLSTVSLNGWQRFTRGWLGFYPETRLRTVVQRGYEISLKNNFNDSPENEKAFLQLIQKMERIYGEFHQSLNLITIHFKDKIGVKVRYVPSPSGTSLKMIQFTLTQTETFSYNVSFKKTAEGKLETKLPENVYCPLQDRGRTYFPWDIVWGSPHNNHTLSSAHKAILSLFCKIIHDSSLTHEGILYYAPRFPDEETNKYYLSRIKEHFWYPEPSLPAPDSRTQVIYISRLLSQSYGRDETLAPTGLNFAIRNLIP